MRSLAKKKIIQDMLRATEEDEHVWKVVIVDDEALHILSAVCKMTDIIDENVTLVEKLFFSRKPFRDMAAIYFITPDRASVSAMIEDFQDVPKYASAHVFFTSTLTDDLMDEISISPMAEYIRNIKELNMEFLGKL